ncbi:hypothetical protein BD770DRAFT_454679 [Pilaira anomala]|nr:hypothetical protein BD770DRAFT_454679 [Pilaira anomala]
MNMQTDRSSTTKESSGSPAPAPALLDEEAVFPFEHVEDEDMLMTDVVDTPAPDDTTYGVPDHKIILLLYPPLEINLMLTIQQDGSVPKSTPVFDAAATTLSYQRKIDELQQEALKTDDIARMEEIDAYDNNVVLLNHSVPSFNYKAMKFVTAWRTRLLFKMSNRSFLPCNSSLTLINSITIPTGDCTWVHVASIFKNLLPATRLVEKKLKNAVPANSIHLPNTLVILFQFLEIQVGKIEEEEAMIMKTRDKTGKRSHGQLSAEEGALDVENPDSSKIYRGTNKSLVLKKFFPPTNLCSYFSLANQQPKNGNNQKVNVYCLKKEVKETNNLHNSYFSDDLEDAFGILEKELNFNSTRYHSSFFSTKNNMHPYVNTFITNAILNNNENSMPIPILNQSINIENDDIICNNHYGH